MPSNNAPIAIHTTKINIMTIKNFEEQLDYYAVEYYGEFGYDTLSTEEKKEVIKMIIQKLYE